tara:strand:- start:8082 stop:8696 length:615 start_codon:yes stop_codon:yes gene_type:complete
MGKVAKVALPIAAIAGVGLATGGFGLGAGASSLGTGMGLSGAMGASTGAIGSSGFSLGSLFTSSNLGLVSSGIGAISQIGAGAQGNQLAQLQMKQLQDQRNIREVQILQEQNELRERRNRWVSTVRASGRDDPSSRALLKDGDNTFQREMRNIGITGRGDISAFNTSIQSQRLTGRNALFSGFVSGGRSLISGASAFQKTRGIT